MNHKLTRCGFIEKKHFRFPHKSPSNRYPLLLTSREFDPTLANHSIVSVREQVLVLNKVVGIRSPAGLVNNLIGHPFLLKTVEYVLSNGSRE